jgi:hypothetical protein
MKIVLTALVLGASLLNGPAAQAATVDPVFPRGLPMAPSEDSCYVYRCVWDGVHQGNGKGLSLILTRYHGEYIPKEIFHRRAHRLIAAYCARPHVTCRGYED